MRAKFLFTILFAYAVAVIAITMFPIRRHPPGYWAGEPWWTMIHWIPGQVDLPSTVLNVIMFVPYGVLAPLLWRTADAARKLALLAALSSTAIELTQLVIGVTVGSRRTVDINDVLANTAGALLGLLILRLALPQAAHRRLLRP